VNHGITFTVERMPISSNNCAERFSILFACDFFMICRIMLAFDFEDLPFTIFLKSVCSKTQNAS
jgi:hypothetical protein